MFSFDLDKTFTPFINSMTSCRFTKFDFPSGFEPHFKINDIFSDQEVFITCRLKNCNDLFTIFLATDALKRADNKKINLFIPFFPFARQDRVVNIGEPLSVKVLADLINLQNYNSVTIFDPHSDVTPALINNCKIISNHSLVSTVLSKIKSNYKLVSPDAGAYKKIFSVNKHLGQTLGVYNPIVICDKIRDPQTGNIISTTINTDDFCGQDIYIIDDILDGGRTFIEIAKEAQKRNVGDIFLIVSHYFGTHGEEELKKYFKKIFTTNSIKDMQSDFIVQINLKHLI